MLNYHFTLIFLLIIAFGVISGNIIYPLHYHSNFGTFLLQISGMQPGVDQLLIDLSNSNEIGEEMVLI